MASDMREFHRDLSGPGVELFQLLTGRKPSLQDLTAIGDAFREEGGTAEERVRAYVQDITSGNTEQFSQQFGLTPDGPVPSPAPSGEAGSIVDPRLQGGSTVDPAGLALGGAAQTPPAGAGALDILASFLSPEERAALSGSAGGGVAEDTGAVSSGMLAGMVFAVEGRQAQAIHESLKEPLSRSPKDIRELQRNLVAAGYLSADSINMPGWYDGATANAYSLALVDASVRQADVETVLRQRILMGDVVTDKSALKGLRAEEREEQAHKQALTDAYFKVWGQSPPPGYVQNFMSLNSIEFEAQEQSKDAWLDSPVGQVEQAHLAGELDRFFSGSQFQQQQQDFEAGTGVFAGTDPLRPPKKKSVAELRKELG